MIHFNLISSENPLPVGIEVDHPSEVFQDATPIRNWQGWDYRDASNKRRDKPYPHPEYGPDSYNAYGMDKLAPAPEGRRFLFSTFPHTGLWSNKNDRIRDSDGNLPPDPGSYRPTMFTGAYGYSSFLPLYGMEEGRARMASEVAKALAKGITIDYVSFDGETLPRGEDKVKSAWRNAARLEKDYETRIKPIFNRHLRKATGDPNIEWYFEGDPNIPAGYKWGGTSPDEIITSVAHEVYGYAMWYMCEPVRTAFGAKVLNCNYEQDGQEKGYFTGWLYSDTQPAYMGLGDQLDLNYLNGASSLEVMRLPAGSVHPTRDGLRRTENGTLPSPTIYGFNTSNNFPTPATGFNAARYHYKQLEASREVQIGREFVLVAPWIYGPGVRFSAWNTSMRTDPDNVSYDLGSGPVYNKYHDAICRMLFLTSGQYAELSRAVVKDFNSRTFDSSGGNNASDRHFYLLGEDIKLHTGITLPRKPILQGGITEWYDNEYAKLGHKMLRGRSLNAMGCYIPNHASGPRAVYEVMIERVNVGYRWPQDPALLYATWPPVTVGVFHNGTQVDTLVIPAGEVSARYVDTQPYITDNGGYAVEGLEFLILNGNPMRENLLDPVLLNMSDASIWNNASKFFISTPSTPHPDSTQPVYKGPGSGGTTGNKTIDLITTDKYGNPFEVGVSYIFFAEAMSASSDSKKHSVVVYDQNDVSIGTSSSPGSVVPDRWDTHMVRFTMPEGGIRLYHYWYRCFMTNQALIKDSLVPTKLL